LIEFISYKKQTYYNQLSENCKIRYDFAYMFQQKLNFLTFKELRHF